jgi:hypothetical protein
MREYNKRVLTLDKRKKKYIRRTLKFFLGKSLSVRRGKHEGTNKRKGLERPQPGSNEQ